MPMTESTNTNLDAHYTHTRVLDKIPSEEQIKEILAKIGKTSPESMLNCGTCGYPTCRDKAIAVFQGKADLKMCLPYMREKAESMSNIIIENTPNAIFMIDHDFNVLEYNRAARELFHIEEKSKAIGMPIEMFLSPENFVKLRETNESVFDSLSKSQDGTLSLRQTILSVSHGDYLVLVRDVTKEEESNEELEQIRKETVETAQKVIDKQMRVAQEIASLLGETTGETKAALTKLKKSIAQGGHL